MRAVRMTAFGGPEVLETTTLEDPVPGPGELLVDVAVAEVLFLDTQLRSGWGRDFFVNVAPPFVLGGGVVGTVLAVGEGVDAGWVGTRVMGGTSGGGEYRGGGYAERVAIPAAGAHAVPDGVGDAEAMAAHNDGLMGVTRVERAGLVAGQTALVTAAAGSIGTWLIPLLKADGVRVVGVARGAGKVAAVRERGADLALDSAADGWVEAIDGPVEAVFDGAGGSVGTTAFARVRDGGTFFAYGAAAGDFARTADRDVTVVGITDSPGARVRHAASGRALERIVDGTVVPVIGQSLPLERAAAAHAAIAARRVIGKTVLTR